MSGNDAEDPVVTGPAATGPAVTGPAVTGPVVTETAVTDALVVRDAQPDRPRILVLEHDPADPPLLLGDWLTEAGATLTVLRLHAGDEVPRDLSDVDAVVSMGGEMGAEDDDVAPWLPATRRLLGAAAAAGTPTLGVCLGAQLLAVATGGRVRRGADGPEIGAYLAAKRDAAESDPLFAGLPLSPDVMQFHYDVVDGLPPGAVLLLSSTGYPNQAFRVGAAAWGIQFHIEATARVLRGWGALDGDAPGGASQQGSAARTAVPRTARFGPMLDEAEELMGQVWRAFAHRFVELARDGVPGTPTGRAGPRLPLVTSEPAGPTGAGDAAGSSGAGDAAGSSGAGGAAGLSVAGHPTDPRDADGSPGATESG